MSCACGACYRVHEENAGKKARCPKCKGIIAIPSRSEESASQSSHSPTTSTRPQGPNVSLRRGSLQVRAPAARPSARPPPAGGFSSGNVAAWYAVAFAVVLSVATSLLFYDSLSCELRSAPGHPYRVDVKELVISIVGAVIAGATFAVGARRLCITALWPALPILMLATFLFAFATNFEIVSPYWFTNSHSVRTIRADGSMNAPFPIRERYLLQGG